MGVAGGERRRLTNHCPTPPPAQGTEGSTDAVRRRYNALASFDRLAFETDTRAQALTHTHTHTRLPSRLGGHGDTGRAAIGRHPRRRFAATAHLVVHAAVKLRVENDIMCGAL